MIEQWGIVKKRSNLSAGDGWSFDINMPLSFSNYNYCVTFGSTNDNGSEWPGGEEIFAKKQSDFRTLKARFYCRNTYDTCVSPCVNWRAIGY